MKTMLREDALCLPMALIIIYSSLPSCVAISVELSGIDPPTWVPQRYTALPLPHMCTPALTAAYVARRGASAGPFEAVLLKTESFFQHS